MQLIHYSDVEDVYDTPERIGGLVSGIERVRRPDSVVVGTGDNLGPSVISLVTEGEQSVAFFEAIRTDVATFGNHDFDYETTADLVDRTPQTWVSANVERERSPFAGVQRTTVIERDGETIGVLGVTEPEAGIDDSVTVRDPVTAARNAMADLPATDWTVLLAHVNEDTLFELARQTDTDVILAGHVHDRLEESVGGTRIVRPGAGGRAFWTVELDGSATCHEVEPDDTPAVVDDLTRQHRTAGLTEVVDHAETPLDRDRSRCFDGDCPAGRLVATAYQWAGDADVGLVDTRGIRNGPPLVGEVTVGDLIGLVPFDGPLQVVAVSGRRLRKTVSVAVRDSCPSAGRPDRTTWWGQFAGVTPDGSTDTVEDEQIDPDRQYEIATNPFVVHADDEFTTIGPDDVVRTGRLQYRAVVEYVRECGTDGFE